MRSWLLAIPLAALLAACGGTAPPGAEEPVWQRPALTDALTAGGSATSVQAAFAGDIAIVVWTEGDRLFLAEDGGAGFSAPKPVSSEGARVYTYDLAANGHGQAVLIWREDNRVKVWRRDPEGWGSPADLGLSDPMQVAAALDEAGNAWVARRIKVGSEYRVRVARWDGSQWTLSYETASGAGARSPSLAAHDGRALLAWENTSDHVVEAVLYDGSWGTPVRLDYGMTNRDPRAVLGPSGAAVLWEAGGIMMDDETYLARELEGSWSSVRLGARASYAGAASMRDALLAVWQQGQSGLSAVFAKRFGEAPTRDAILSLPDADGRYPALAARADRALVAWIQAQPGGGGQVLVAERTPEGWRLPTREEALSPAGTSIAGKKPAMALGEGGIALVAWIQKDEGGTSRVYAALRR